MLFFYDTCFVVLYTHAGTQPNRTQKQYFYSPTLRKKNKQNGTEIFNSINRQLFATFTKIYYTFIS